MVATLLRLRLLLLKNSLLRNKWQLVAVIIGAVYGLSILGFAAVGLVALSFAPVELTFTIVTLAGSVLLLGWLILPLVLAGIDQSLDPSQLATFPIPIDKLLAGLVLAGLFGVPGVITLLAALSTAGTWWRDPLAAAAAILCAVVGTLTCVAGSRLVATLATGLSSHRRYREITGVIVFVPLILLGPILASLGSGIADAADSLPLVATVLSWTPLGAVWSVPAEIALGNALPAIVKLLIGLATLGVIVLLWRRSLSAALVSTARDSVRTKKSGSLGLFGVMPQTPTGAVAARALTYWVRDPRYSRQLIVVPLIPVLLIFYASITDTDGLVAWSGPLVAFLLALATFADLSYDSTAFAMHVSSGVSGIADRLGRVIALGSFGIPLVILTTIATVWYSGEWRMLPGLMGLALGMILTGLGVTSLSSARIVIPVPAPGDSPFKAKPGAGFTTTLISLVVWVILGALVLPEAVLAVVGFVTGNIALGWLALAVGIALGSTLLAIGVRSGGRTLERREPELLASLRRMD